MGLDRAAAAAASPSGSCGPSASHSSSGMSRSSAGKHDHARRGSRATAPSSRATAGAAVVMPAAQTKPGRRRARASAARPRRAAGCGARRGRSGRARCEQRRPVGEDQPQLVERLLPVQRKIGQLGGEAARPRRDRPPRSAAGRACGRDPRRGAAPRPRRRRDGAGPAGRAASAARAGSIAGGIGASSPSGSSTPPIRSSSSGSPTGTRRGSSSPPPERRTKASWIARAARLLGTSTIPCARPVFSAPKRAISPAASASAKARCGGMVKTLGRRLTRRA